jgi:hypothetical protein
MNLDFRKVVVTILSIIVAVLGGNSYQQSSLLNDTQKSVKELAQVVNTLARTDTARFESE